MMFLTIGVVFLFAGGYFANVNWADAEKNIKYLNPGQVRELPLTVKKSLESQNCKIPQTYISDKSHNFVKGSFAKAQRKDWAVLCAKNGQSSIVIVWEKEQPCPAELAVQQINEKDVFFSRYISAASKDTILNHQKAYGGPLPKKLDHQGIDDAFLEKASVTYYCQNGKWLSLTGAD